MPESSPFLNSFSNVVNDLDLMASNFAEVKVVFNNYINLETDPGRKDLAKEALMSAINVKFELENIINNLRKIYVSLNELEAN